MRILMFNYSEVKSPGGVHKVILETSKNLSKNGHKVTVLQGNQMNLPDREIYGGFEIIRIKSRIADYLYGLSPEIYFYIKKHLIEINPDIVHIHGYHTLFSPEVMHIIKKIQPKVPIVFSPHFGIFSRTTFGGKYLWDIYNNLIGKKMMINSDLIITASEFEAITIKTLFKIPKERLKVISHGVSSINTNNNKTRNNKINLLYVGHLLPLKGVQYIIEAIHELIYQKKTEVCLTIVGEGLYQDNLKRLSEKLNVSEFIKWEGFIKSSQHEKLVDLYKKSDILLLLSKSENYGLVVSEALAAGTPVIVTKRTALNEFLNEPGCFGVEYPPDKIKVADLVMEIYHNNVIVGVLEKVKTWDKVAECYEDIYIRILGNVV